MNSVLHADLILTKGKIITVDGKNSVTESVAVKDGKIVALGPSKEIDLLASA